jgi:hypothetical protein
MEAAKEWGTPPWMITGGSPALWFLRYQVVYRERARAQEK